MARRRVILFAGHAIIVASRDRFRFVDCKVGYISVVRLDLLRLQRVEVVIWSRTTCSLKLVQFVRIPTQVALLLILVVDGVKLHLLGAPQLLNLLLDHLELHVLLVELLLVFLDLFLKLLLQFQLLFQLLVMVFPFLVP